MFAKDNKGSGHRATIVAGVFVLALSTAAAGAYVALADQHAALPAAVSVVSVPRAPADLERAFWVCDYVATNYGVQATPVDACMEATAALQDRKFGGDFAQLLEWWGRNKTTEHAKVQAAQLAGNSIR